VIVWTEGCMTPPVMGVVTHIGVPVLDPMRQEIRLLADAKHLWFERGDLRVINEAG
jgi:hypothetical protein